MRIQLMLFLIVGTGAVAPLRAADVQPMVFDVTGNMHIHQSTPTSCSDVNMDVPIAGGRFEIAPAEGFDLGGGQRRFVLTRGSVTMSPFTVNVDCLIGGETRRYGALSVELGQTASFVGLSSGSNIFAFTIPAGDVLLSEAAIANDAPEMGDKHPSGPVTGTLDLAHGTLQVRVAVATRIHVDALGDFDGSQTAVIAGQIAFPDADGDGVPDGSDNCRLVSNADQAPVSSPEVHTPADVVLHSCADTRIGQAMALDICDGGPVTVTNDAPQPYPLGRTQVTWSAEDTHGRVGTGTQAVTVSDTTPPVFITVPSDTTLHDCGRLCLGPPTADDDCGGSPAFTNDAPASFPAGRTVVTWTATDTSGNRARATQTVTVDDGVAPRVSCAPGSNPGGYGYGGGGFFQVSASDHCDAPTIRLGGFVLADRETIKITETGEPGVRLVEVIGPAHIRHFHVHHGQSVITAADASGNVASAVCR